MAGAPPPPAELDEATAKIPYPSAKVGWYAVFVLLIMFMLSFTDRQIVGLMADPLQKDLGLTDTELGLLQGFAFGVLHVLAGMFLGWATDRYSRRMLIFWGVIVWSISCAASGLSRGFWGLFAGRVGVGVGEATLMPAAYSILADLFPREKLSLAVGVFTLGANLGIALSFTLGGLIVGMLSGSAGHELPVVGVLQAWQITFILVGAPGALLAFLMFTLPEPIRRGRLSDSAKGEFLKPLFKFMGRRPLLFACHFTGFSLNNLLGYAMLAWAPALLGRRYGWDPSHIGPAVGVVIGVAGMTGSVASGFIADRLFQRGIQDVHFRLQACLFGLMVPSAILLGVAPSAPLFLLGLGGVYICSSATVPNGAVTLQMVAPNELRGRLSSAYGFCAGLFGLGLGPLFVGLLTDHVFHDKTMVGISMSIVVATSAVLACLCMLIGRRSYGDGVREMHELMQKADLKTLPVGAATAGAPDPA